jgi:hypothetical protein
LQDIVGNFVHLMATYGHIPNGIRTYYINRSQPPLFSEMARIVYEATANRTLLRWVAGWVCGGWLGIRMLGPSTANGLLSCSGTQSAAVSPGRSGKCNGLVAKVCH